MEVLASTDRSPEMYPVSIPKNGTVHRLRGAGKHLWCGRKAAETLGFGGDVWVKRASLTEEKKFSTTVRKILNFNVGTRKKEYDFLLNSADLKEIGCSFFGDYSFSETVGLWLEHGEKEASNLLSPFISTEGFIFSPEEFVELLDRLRVAMRRYDRLPAVSKGLEDLNTGFFRHKSLSESTTFIRKHLTEYLDRGDSLHRQFLLVINRNARLRLVGKRREWNERSSLLDGLEKKLTNATKLTGRGQKKAVSLVATEWQEYLQKYGLWEGEEREPQNTEDLSAVFTKEQKSISTAFRFIGREAKTEAISLNALTVNPDYIAPETLRELERQLNELLREVDEAGLYQLPLRLTDAATTPRQLQQLESLLGKLRNTERHLGEFPMFYDRRHFWYAQPAHLRRLLAPLLELPAEDWETAFSSWYFERCLERERRAERFFNEEEKEPPELANTSRLATMSRGELHFLAPDASWPTNPKPKDLFIDLSGGVPQQTGTKNQVLVVAPLSDVSAMHLAVSGRRDPALLFSQSFQPLHAPAWSSHKVEAPPAGPKHTVLVQIEEGSPWLALSEWENEATTKINIFLPEKLSGSEEEIFVKRWEELVLAAPSITFFHRLNPASITEGLLSDGVNGAFLISAFLRAAEAAEATPFDSEELVAIGREVRLRCGLSEAEPHPLAVAFGATIKTKLPDYFVQTHVPWRDTFLPLVVQSPSGKKTVIIPNGRLPGLAGGYTEAARHRELKTAGFGVYNLNALRVWENLDAELKLVVQCVVV